MNHMLTFVVDVEAVVFGAACNVVAVSVAMAVGGEADKVFLVLMSGETRLRKRLSGQFASAFPQF